MEFFGMLVQLIFALGVTLGIMFLSFKLVGTKINTINNNKYVKIIDRVQITKENTILVVKIGKKGFVITSTAANVEKLLELSEDEINEIEEDKKKSAKDMSDAYNKFVSKYKKKLK